MLSLSLCFLAPFPQFFPSVRENQKLSDVSCVENRGKSNTAASVQAQTNIIHAAYECANVSKKFICIIYVYISNCQCQTDLMLRLLWSI